MIYIYTVYIYKSFYDPNNGRISPRLGNLQCHSLGTCWYVGIHLTIQVEAKNRNDSCDSCIYLKKQNVRNASQIHSSWWFQPFSFPCGRELISHAMLLNSEEGGCCTWHQNFSCSLESEQHSQGPSPSLTSFAPGGLC